MIELNGWKTTWASLFLCAAIAVPASAQKVTTLVDFEAADGGSPQAPLVQGRDGNFYGEAGGGDGSCHCGTLFKLTPTGSLTVIHNFTGQSEGSYPRGGLILGTDGNFYGTTLQGGTYNYGTFFKVTPTGQVTTIYTFSNQGKDGYNPRSGVIQGRDGAFYGTTFDGGANECNDMNCGTIFKITPDGTLTTLHNFDFSEGTNPSGGLIQGADGAFYGTALYGGDPKCYVAYEQDGCGVVFKMDFQGNVTVVHQFEMYDGADPVSLIQGNDGNLYGMTSFGGNLDCDSPDGCGTVFRIRPNGKLSTIHKFNGARDGGFPTGQLIQATDGSLYGAAEWSGNNPCSAPNGHPCGTVFRVVPGGTFSTLYSFCEQPGCADGSWAQGSLIQDTNGLLYGTTFEGGDQTCAPGFGCGTVFTLDMGLGPFVSFVRNYGRVGQTGGILGQGFNGTTSVTLNGVPASFNVISDTYLVATVPPGAITGYVTVTTPSGTLTSNKPFVVLP